MGAEPKLVEDVRTVSFDGAAGDVELLADLLTGVAGRNKLEHFDLPLGEASSPLVGGISCPGVNEWEMVRAGLMNMSPLCTARTPVTTSPVPAPLTT